MTKTLPFRTPRPEPDWWYEALEGFSPEDRALIERTIATPSEAARLPLSAEEEQLARATIERYLQQERFRP